MFVSPAMKVAFPSVVVALAVQSWPPSLAAQSALFRKVPLSQTRLMTSRQLESATVALNTFQTLQCATKCSAQPWCDLWCLSADQCYLSDMIVMPGYAETNMADALVCFTRRYKDYAAGAIIQGTTHNIADPLRVVENLADGIYDMYTRDMCYISLQSSTNHWFLLDFRAPVTFHIVKLFTQAGGLSSMLLNLANLEVRIGMSPVSHVGDFSSYSLFGTFPGPATSFSQEIVIKAPVPMAARFLSVQKVNGTNYIQFCHLEVY